MGEHVGRWKGSRFNLSARDSDSSLLIFNSLTGAFMQFTGEFANRAAGLVAKGSRTERDGTDTLSEALAANGILVREDADELARAEAVHKSLRARSDYLQLIIMPTEKCNFRCVYCYESFAKGRMSAEVMHSIVRFVQQQRTALRSLSVSWFGGEPLTALKVVEDLSNQLLEICAEGGIAYHGSMTTNGYLLTEDVATRCLAARVTHFQVTLDGPATTHNTLRVLAGGRDTFDEIIANLQSLKARPDKFEVSLRVNYTPQVAVLLPGFLQFLAAEFGGDDRFAVNCHAVGHWGGPNDEAIQTCDAKSAEDVEVRFMSDAAVAGFSPVSWQESMRPHGSVCYAADPRSFVLGSDGTVYKCTVAFDDPRNQLGSLKPDGTLDISEHLHELWISSGEETDVGCQHCAFRPACQGNYCPLERLQNGQKTCPPVKVDPGRYLPILAAHARMSMAERSVT